jgi:hypothetical protein
MSQPPCPYLVCSWNRVSICVPKTQKFRNLCGETSKPLHQVAKNPSKKIGQLIQDVVWHALSFAATCMTIAGLCVEAWAHLLPPKPKISKFLWEISQSPAPYSQDPPGLTPPPDRICSLTCSWMCKNPHVHSWSVAGTVCAYGSPKPKNFEISVGEFPNPCTNYAKSP